MKESAKNSTFDGLMISDGALIFSYREYRYQQSSRIKEFLEWSQQSLPNKSKIYGPRTRYHKVWKKCYTSFELISSVDEYYSQQYERWYKNGTKIIPEDFIITPESLLAAYLGDGCLHKRPDGTVTIIQLCTESFTKCENDRLADLLNKSGISAYVGRVRNGFNVKVRTSAVRDYFDFISSASHEVDFYKHKFAVKFKGSRIDRKLLREIRTLFDSGRSKSDIARITGFSPTSIGNIINGKTWSCV